MEKNSMAVMDKALYTLKQKFGDRTDLAYAAFAGYAIAMVDLKTAEAILKIVEESK